MRRRRVRDVGVCLPANHRARGQGLQGSRRHAPALPQSVHEPRRLHRLVKVKAQHAQRTAPMGLAGRTCPSRWSGSIPPRAHRAWAWPEAFPSARRLSTDPRTGWRQRHHLWRRTSCKPRWKKAVSLPGVAKPASCCHTWRHSFCHAPAGKRLRHSHRPGAARAQGREHDDDLPPRAQPAGR